MKRGQVNQAGLNQFVPHTPEATERLRRDTSDFPSPASAAAEQYKNVWDSRNEINYETIFNFAVKIISEQKICLRHMGFDLRCAPSGSARFWRFLHHESHLAHTLNRKLNSQKFSTRQRLLVFSHVGVEGGGQIKLTSFGRWSGHFRFGLDCWAFSASGFHANYAADRCHLVAFGWELAHHTGPRK